MPGWGQFKIFLTLSTLLSLFTFTFHFHALEKEMATHSSVLAWRIPGVAEPGGLQSMWSHRVRHDWSDLAAAAAMKNNLKYMCINTMFVLSFSVVSDSLKPRGLYVARQAPLSLGFPRQEDWKGLPFPSAGDLPNPGIEPSLLQCRQTL